MSEPQPTDTTFMQRAGKVVTQPKVVAGGGLGLSAAAVIFMYQVFAPIGDVTKLRETQTRQWETISELRKEVAAQRADARSYQMLLEYLTTGGIKPPTTTNKNENSK